MLPLERCDRSRCAPVNARGDFARGLSARPTAPGAAKELATLDAAEKKFELAQEELERYSALAGADPEALTLLAVLKTNLGKSAAGVAAVQQARDLLGDEAWRGAELEAQVRARAGDAAGAVAALRRLEADGRLNRAALRSDAAYLPIADDPAWVAFINEKPPAPASRVPPSKRSVTSDKC